MQPVQSKMYKNLLIAMDQKRKLTSKAMDIAESQIREVSTLKHEMETIAVQRGYSQACRKSIPVCKGECCKWHFPKYLNHIDFFIAIFHMAETQQKKLADQIFNTQKAHCPMLLKTGCFLSFEKRPILCTNAYPCFNDRSYWVEKEKKNILFNKTIKGLEDILIVQ